MTYRWGDYTPSFPIPAPLYGRAGAASTFLGADVGFSCMLDPARSVWTFGDTYYGPYRRVGGTVGSTVAVGSCRSGSFSAAYYHGGSGGAVAPFFDDGAPPGTRIAGQKPFLYGGRLYVLGARILNAGVRFVPVGALAVRVDNPASPPPQWSADYLTLSRSGPPAAPALGSEALVLPPDLVLYGLIPGRTVACKVPLARLGSAPAGSDLSGDLEYLGSDAAWHPASDPAPDYLDCLVPTTAGFSVRFNNTLGAFQAVWTDTTAPGVRPGFPPCVTVGLSSWPFGPWETRVLGYFPEMTPTNPAFHPDNVVYGVKEVTDFEAEPGRGRVAVTYTVASYSAMRGDPTRQLADPSCYRVKFSRFANPFA